MEDEEQNSAPPAPASQISFPERCYGLGAGDLESSGFERRDFSEQLYGLWDELSDFRPEGMEQALQHCLLRLCEWLGADNAFWVGAVRLLEGSQASRDPLNGWRMGVLKSLRETETHRVSNRSLIHAVQADTPGHVTQAIISMSGRFRVFSLHSGLVDLAEFKKTPHYDYFYRQFDVNDRIWAAFPISSSTESYFIFDKFGEGHCFSARDLLVAGQALRGMKWFHRMLLMSYGLGICRTCLTPAERRVLSELLSGASEKVIAKRLNLTPGSVHQYSVRIYRNFGVHGRAGLIALWVGGSASDRMD